MSNLRNCTTCKFHHCYYDSYGFDGCTCDKQSLWDDRGAEHKWCHEHGWGHDFDPDIHNCECEFYEKGDGV